MASGTCLFCTCQIKPEYVLCILCQQPGYWINQWRIHMLKFHRMHPYYLQVQRYGVESEGGITIYENYSFYIRGQKVWEMETISLIGEETPCLGTHFTRIDHSTGGAYRWYYRFQSRVHDEQFTEADHHWLLNWTFKFDS